MPPREFSTKGATPGASAPPASPKGSTYAERAEARNVRDSLATRLSRDLPLVAQAVAEALPRLIDGELFLRYGPSKRHQFRAVKRAEENIARYADHRVKAVLL